MNTYRHTFTAACPGNGEHIIYQLELRHPDMVRVEHIKTACALHREGFQEAIAQDLHARFGGVLIIRANHHGVDIETRLAPTPAAQADSQTEPVLGYPPLPHELTRTDRGHLIQRFRVEELMRAYVDADRAARNQGGAT